MRAIVVVLCEELADLLGSDGGSLRRRFGGLDEDWQMENFFFLAKISGLLVLRVAVTYGIVGTARLAEESL